MSGDEATETTSQIARRTQFRSADGRVQDKQKRLTRILDYLIATTTINEEGKLRVRNPTDLRWRPLLATAFSLSLPDGSALNQWDTESLVWDAFIRLRQQSTPFSVERWAEECDARLEEMLLQGVQAFRVRTTVSLAEEATDWLIGLPYEYAVLADSLSEFPIPPCLNKPGAERHLARLRALRYMAIQIQVPALTPNEAVHRAINALSVWRGLMSLYANRSQWAMTFGGGERKPLAVVEAGPILVVTDADGNTVDQYWYEAPRLEEREVFTPRKDDSHRFALMTHAVIQMKSLPYQADLEGLLVRYADALAHTDYSMAVVYLWGVLESLVGGRSGDQKIVSKRAVALDARRREQDFANDVLDLVRVSRNGLVHAGVRPYSEEQVAYLLKPVVDRHLRHLIRNPNNYTRLEDHRQAMARSSGTITQAHRPECDCTAVATP